MFYAAIRLADGRRLQRRIGPAWLSRSRPPAGHLTRAQAEARLRDILVGADPNISIAGSGVTFGVAAESWLAYIRDDRKRRPSTVSGYRRELDRNLLPEFGADTPLEEITTQEIDAYRERLVAEGELSARTINKRLAQLHAIFKRAQRTYGLAKNPVEAAERQPHRLSGDIAVLDARQVELLASKAANEQDAAIFRVAAFTGLRLGELRALRWGRRRLDAPGDPRTTLVYLGRGGSAEVREGPLGAALRSAREGAGGVEPQGSVDRRR